jgi:hypothetical protein
MKLGKKDRGTVVRVKCVDCGEYFMANNTNTKMCKECYLWSKKVKGYRYAETKSVRKGLIKIGLMK